MALDGLDGNLRQGMAGMALGCFSFVLKYIKNRHFVASSGRWVLFKTVQTVQGDQNDYTFIPPFLFRVVNLTTFALECRPFVVIIVLAVVFSVFSTLKPRICYESQKT